MRQERDFRSGFKLHFVLMGLFAVIAIAALAIAVGVF
jgi:hypothetical protein